MGTLSEILAPWKLKQIFTKHILQHSSERVEYLGIDLVSDWFNYQGAKISST